MIALELFPKIQHVLVSGGSRPSDKGWGGGGGGGHPDPDISGGGGSPKKNFPALWASVWSKNKGLGPSLGSATACLHYFPYAISAKFVCIYKLIGS